jgi:hypothetical protein
LRPWAWWTRRGINLAGCFPDDLSRTNDGKAKYFVVGFKAGAGLPFDITARFVGSVEHIAKPRFIPLVHK